MKQFGRFAMLVLAVLLASSTLANASQHCFIEDDLLICNPSGTIPISNPGSPPGPGSDTEPAPLQYFKTRIDPGIGECWYWSSIPGGLDSSSSASDPLIIATIVSLPPCPSRAASPGVEPTAEELAWEVLRTFSLATPHPTFAPPDAGITGLTTFLGHSFVTELDYAETLPSGIDLEVRAIVSSVEVDWGDGARGSYLLSDLAGAPSDSVSHTYLLKTCAPEYRANHPSGGLCHPSLEAYPVRVTFLWEAGYQYDSGWVPLDSVALTTTVPYDVDEVVGVRTSP